MPQGASLLMHAVLDVSVLHFACCTCELPVGTVSAAHCVSASVLGGSGYVQKSHVSPSNILQETRATATVHRGAFGYQE